MILPDVNVLLTAFRPDATDHKTNNRWLTSVVSASGDFGMSPQVLSSVIRIASNPVIYAQPTPTAEVISFATALLKQPNCRVIQPGRRHWAIFCDLCNRAGSKGKHVPDAWLAALAIEHDCEWISADKGFARFPGLRWRGIE